MDRCNNMILKIPAESISSKKYHSSDPEGRKPHIEVVTDVVSANVDFLCWRHPFIFLRVAIKNNIYINADYDFDKFEYKEETKLIL